MMPPMQVNHLNVIIEVGPDLDVSLLAAKYTDGYVWRQSDQLMIAKDSKIWRL